MIDIDTLSDIRSQDNNPINEALLNYSYTKIEHIQKGLTSSLPISAYAIDDIIQKVA